MTAVHGPDDLRMPASVVERVRALAAGSAPASARDAATVVLLRDAPAGLEAYLLRRVSSMAFAAGMHVFPGGSVDERDAELPDDRWAGPAPTAWARVLGGTEPLARSLVCAAVRETFEESGVLLAGPSATEVVPATTGPEWERDRRALLDRSLSLAGLLERRSLLLRTDLLRGWAHWITPEAEPRRYDTRFFVAAVPAGQLTRDVGGEADTVLWLAPQQALDRRAAGVMHMLPPTAFTLAELTGYATVADVLSAGTARDIRPVLPRVVLTGADEAEILLPGDPGYDG